MSGEKQKFLEPWKDLQGKVVMVTGASAGIGRDLCLDLAKSGCKIVAAARRIDRLKSLCDEINTKWAAVDASIRAVAVELDVSAKGSQIKSWVLKAWDAFGRIDALVNNVGVRGSVATPLDMSDDEWDDTLQTNLTGSWLVSKYACSCMRKAGHPGSVINIASIAGLDRGQLPGGVGYSASKAAVNAMTRVMALELGVHKIRVNSISPRLFKSEITDA